MILRVTADLALALDDPSDFKRFKVAVARPDTDFAVVAGRNRNVLRFQDEKTAWVNAASFASFSGLSNDPSWSEPFYGMLEYCKKMGWLSEDGREFRAHVEWMP
jgi:hypothetical protein